MCPHTLGIVNPHYSNLDISLQHFGWFSSTVSTLCTSCMSVTDTPPCSDFLLVAESKEERKHWIEALQNENPSLVSDHSQHHTERIHPDTPPQARREAHTHSEDAASAQSSVVSTIVTSADVEVHDTMHLGQTLRPGSPRHGLHKLISTEGSGQSDPDHLHLDIRYLNIAEGHSDNEES